MRQVRDRLGDLLERREPDFVKQQRQYNRCRKSEDNVVRADQDRITDDPPEVGGHIE
ncbi:hypothetical protein D3C71_2039700 [compost metagenome]